MREIKPIQIWNNGINKTGIYLNTYVVNDNLNNYAKFYYEIITSDSIIISFGDLIMDGTDYHEYLTNEYAYQFIATKLGLTLI